MRQTGLDCPVVVWQPQCDVKTDHFYTLLFVQIKQMRYNLLSSELQRCKQVDFVIDVAVSPVSSVYAKLS